MPIMNVAFWMLIALAVGVAGVLTVLDDILSDTAHAEPHAELKAYSESGSKDTERRSGRECRT